VRKIIEYVKQPLSLGDNPIAVNKYYYSCFSQFCECA